MTMFHLPPSASLSSRTTKASVSGILHVPLQGRAVSPVLSRSREAALAPPPQSMLEQLCQLIPGCREAL